MRKSAWIEVLEWGFLPVVIVFVAGVVVMRGEITNSPEDGTTAPLVTLAEP
jgi:hypothetical protein